MKTTCSSRELLTRHGIDPNPNRDLILGIIASSAQAIPPKSILSAARKKRRMDKVTLYRILDLLVDKRVLRRIATLTGTMRYEVVCAEHNPQHPHFVCRCCGDMECLEDFDLTEVRKGIQKKGKHVTEDIDLKLEGLCSKCSPELKGARAP